MFIEQLNTQPHGSKFPTIYRSMTKQSQDVVFMLSDEFQSRLGGKLLTEATCIPVLWLEFMFVYKARRTR